MIFLANDKALSAYMTIYIVIHLRIAQNFEKNAPYTQKCRESFVYNISKKAASSFSRKVA